MIEIRDKYYCTGCNACNEICPKQCITMIEDNEGFLYPNVNKNFCINCHICEKICPVLNLQQHNDNSAGIKVYGSYAKDEETRMRSSSGGIFPIIAKLILESGGKVYGAAFTEDCKLRHISITDMGDLYKLCGSKYLQSDVVGTFQNVKNDLNDGKIILYTGTACQIAGLKKYLGIEYDNLYTIDVLCHGVPSPKLFEKYKNYLIKEYLVDNEQIKNITFRSKEIGWENPTVKVGSYSKTRWNDLYYCLFLSNICLRPSCYSCKFKTFRRISDLTIGDFWGVQKILPNLSDHKGTSVVCVNSNKGEYLFDKVKEQLVVERTELDLAIPVTADSRISVKPHKNRKKFFRNLDNKDFIELRKYINPNLYERIKNRFHIK